jgi:hypothetical protein
MRGLDCRYKVSLLGRGIQSVQIRTHQPGRQRQQMEVWLYKRLIMEVLVLYRKRDEVPIGPASVAITAASFKSLYRSAQTRHAPAPLLNGRKVWRGGVLRWCGGAHQLH